MKPIPRRLGIGGWSYGGEMTAWAITQIEPLQGRRFRRAGVYDQAAEFETEHDAAGDEWYFGRPWEHPDVFARNSPSTYIGNAHTPTLIFDGVDDANNPVGTIERSLSRAQAFGRGDGDGASIPAKVIRRAAGPTISTCSSAYSTGTIVT